MTLSFTGDDFMQALEVASIVGSIVAALLVGLIIYLMVRPKNGQREAARRAMDGLDAEEMIALIDRMERRLAVLERAIGDERGQDRLAARQQEIFEAVEDGRDLGRTK